MEKLLQSLAPVIDYLSNARASEVGFLNDESARLLQENLNRVFANDSSLMQEVFQQMRAGLDEGWLCPHSGRGLTWGHVSDPEHAGGFSIESVFMSNTGPGHVHPKGEIDLCLPITGNPQFDSSSDAWCVYPAQSWHIPTVTDGEMLILYFLPDGEIRFQRQP